MSKDEHLDHLLTDVFHKEEISNSSRNTILNKNAFERKKLKHKSPLVQINLYYENGYQNLDSEKSKVRMFELRRIQIMVIPNLKLANNNDAKINKAK